MSDEGRRALVQSTGLGVPPSKRDKWWKPSGTIPWAVYLEAYAVYENRHPGQSAERMQERGGLCYFEIQACLAGDYKIAGRKTQEEADLPPIPGWEPRRTAT